MKKAFAIRLCTVIIISMLATIFLSYYLQIKTAKEALHTNSMIRIEQISQILEKNDLDVERLKENLKEDYFIRAKAAAYIIQNNPDVIGNLDEIRKIASLLQVDELHLFDEEGRLFDGSEPKYYNYTFNSGEQMQFFLPMLENHSLQLCQDIVPNTAEEKLMQYIAVWREDHKGIIQIGMEPIRLLEAMSKTELKHIFSMISVDKDTTIFVIDPQSGVVIGATDDSMAGKPASDIGVNLKNISKSKDTVMNADILGKKSYCVLEPAGQLLIGISSTYESIYKNMEFNMALVIISICILSVIIILLILRLLDKFILHGIDEMITGMKIIASGNLDYRVRVESSPELIELGNNVNSMVMSLLENTSKLSLVFDNINLPIAVYEYNKDMKRVMATRKIGDILMLSQKELQDILSDHTIFDEKIRQICEHPYSPAEDVYLIGTDELHYIKIQSYQEGHKVLGIASDVTAEIVEKQQLTLERDTDLLTGLCSRRAFYHTMEHMFSEPGQLKTAALLMVDMDNLKYTNDRWGHECGDKLLKTAAALLDSCTAPDKLAARLGGDEFVLLIYNADSQTDIQAYIDELYAQIKLTQVKMTENEQISVSFSGGYIFYPDDTRDYNEMVNLADLTMYKGKRNIKGHFIRYKKE